jgi:polyisoprenoid-binding protein YceI
MMKRRSTLAAAVLLLGGAGMGPVRAQTYRFQADGRSHVRMKARTTTEEFAGHTVRVEGAVDLTPPTGTVKDQVAARVVIDLASMKTGVAMRDRHMREKYLETDRYPKAVFTLRRIVSPARLELLPDRPMVVRVEGTLRMHGVEQPLTTEAQVTRLTHETIGGREFPVEALRVHTAFPVRLSDYKIRRPRFLFIKMSNTLRLEIDLYAEAPRPSRYRKSSRGGPIIGSGWSPLRAATA